MVAKVSETKFYIESIVDKPFCSRFLLVATGNQVGNQPQAPQRPSNNVVEGSAARRQSRKGEGSR